MIWLQHMHFERPKNEEEEPVAGEANDSAASALNESEDAEKNADLDQISSESAKGLMESDKVVHRAHPVTVDAKIKLVW